MSFRHLSGYPASSPPPLFGGRPSGLKLTRLGPRNERASRRAIRRPSAGSGCAKSRVRSRGRRSCYLWTLRVRWGETNSGLWPVRVRDPFPHDGIRSYVDIKQIENLSAFLL